MPRLVPPSADAKGVLDESEHLELGLPQLAVGRDHLRGEIVGGAAGFIVAEDFAQLGGVGTWVREKE